jgi:opacity protein-like surface antigen
MRSSIIAATLAAAVLCPSFAAPFEPGPYLTASVGRSSVSSDYAESSNDISLGGAIGYQYTRNWGFDVHSRSLSLNPLRSAFTEAGYYPDRFYGIAVQGTVPLDDYFSLYGRAGIARTTLRPTRDTMQDRDQTDATVGVGASYAFNRQWSINLEATYLTKSEVSLLSIGGRFQF